MNLDPRIPDGPLQDKWDSRKFDLKLVNPANKRKYKVIVVGSGLAGASAAASLAELVEECERGLGCAGSAQKQATGACQVSEFLA